MEPNTGPQEEVPAIAPLSPSSPWKKAESKLGAVLSKDWGSVDITHRIYQKYSREVDAVHRERQERFRPVDENLDALEVDTSSIKDEIDAALEKARGAENLLTSWASDSYVKKMQNLFESERSGHCTMQYGTDGDFEGDVFCGMRHGQGKVLFRGETYEGEWRWDKRHGRGSAKLADGTQIDGDWLNNKPEGFVRLHNAEGKLVYDGEMKDGKRHGLGRGVFESGDIYDGNWKAGRLHERGTYYFTNGTKLQGSWNEGLYHGVGLFHFPDGSRSRRIYDRGILQSTREYESSTQRFGHTWTREDMQKHVAILEKWGRDDAPASGT